MQDMGGIMRQAQMMQEKIAKLQQELGGRMVEGSSGGGMVRVTATGRQEVLSVVIDPAVVDADDVDMLQDLVLAAVNDALARSREMVEKEMASITGGLKLPGM